MAHHEILMALFGHTGDLIREEYVDTGAFVWRGDIRSSRAK